jgi:hypothetical protein
MADPTRSISAVEEQVWRAWLEKGRQREKATARKLKYFTGIVLALLSLAVAFRLLWGK